MEKFKVGSKIDFKNGYVLEGCTGVVKKCAPEVGMVLVVFDNPKYGYGWYFTENMIVIN